MKIKLSIAVCELKQKLSKLKEFVNKSSILPVLANVLFEIKDKQLKLSVTDLENYATVKVKEIETVNEGQFLIDFYMLYDYVMNTEATVFNIECDKNTMKAVLSDGEITIKFPIDNEDGFPAKWKADSMIGLIDLEDFSDFSKGLTVGLVTASNDDLRPAMTGICISNMRGIDEIVSTDAHRMYMHEIKKSAHALPANTSIIMCKKFCKFMASHVKSGAGQIHATMIDNAYTGTVLTYGDYEIRSRVIDARYPDYKVVIPETSYEYILERKKVKALLKVASPFVHPITKQLTITISKEKAKFMGGEADVDVSVEFNMPVYQNNMSEEFKAAFNAKFLSDALNMSTDRYVSIKHTGSPTRPVMIDGNYLVMPLMIND